MNDLENKTEKNSESPDLTEEGTSSPEQLETLNKGTLSKGGSALATSNGEEINPLIEQQRESLLKDIKTISDELKDDSCLAIAEALPNNEKLELFLKAVSRWGKKLPLYDGRVQSPKPVSEVYDPSSITDMQRLYREDKDLYFQVTQKAKKMLNKILL